MPGGSWVRIPPCPFFAVKITNWIAMKVYRLEHSESGQGPYSHNVRYPAGTVTPEIVDMAIAWSKVKKNLSNAHDFDSDHPCPHDDGMQHLTNYKYGFSSLKSLAEWFNDGWLERLKPFGFVIKVYSVPDDEVEIGNKQVSFPPEFGNSKTLENPEFSR